MLVNTVINDRICYVEMQNSDHFNCLSEAMCQELQDAIHYGYDQECVGIVIKAQCRKGVWSAGHDIRELDADGNTLEGGITVADASLLPQYIVSWCNPNLHAPCWCDSR